MQGTNITTGKPLSGVEHLRQSVRDILTTPIGTRVMLREYGSRLFELIDRPINAEWRMQIFAATAEALAKWEPRLRVDQVQVITAGEGQVELKISGEYLPDGKPVLLDGILVR